MLEVSSLCKSYQQKPVLQNLSLTVSPGEIVFLTGPSGSGKSTALRAIANLDGRDGGDITLEGLSAADIGFSQWRRDVMYVPQYRITHPGTPREFFVRVLKLESRSVPVDEIEPRAEGYVELCLSVGLERDNVVEQRWSELSGGELCPRIIMHKTSD